METIYEDGKSYKLVRLTCNCLSAAHSLDIELDEDEDGYLYGINFEDKYYGKQVPMIQRVKDACKMVRGHPVCLHEFIIKTSDIEPLIGFLQEAKTEFDKKPKTIK
jgi:hypothetical protein